MDAANGVWLEDEIEDICPIMMSRQRPHVIDSIQKKLMIPPKKLYIAHQSIKYLYTLYKIVIYYLFLKQL